MRVRALRSSFAALLLGLAMCGSASAGPWTLAKGENASSFWGNFASSDTYHDENGSRRLLGGGGLIEERGLTWQGEFGWKTKLSVGYSIPFVSSSRRLGGGDHPPYVPSATGFGDAHFALKYAIKNGRSATAVELNWKAPLGYERAPTYFADDSTDINVAEHTDNPKLGEGQQDVSAILHYGTGIGSHAFVQAAGGYTYRFESPANLIVLSADVGYWITGPILIGGQYRGQLASEGDNPTRDSDLHQVGPVVLYRVDDHLDMFVASLHTASATNAIHTDAIYVGMSFKQTKLDRLQGFLGTMKQP
jgi:hypothetical protein